MNRREFMKPGAAAVNAIGSIDHSKTTQPKPSPAKGPMIEGEEPKIKLPGGLELQLMCDLDRFSSGKLVMRIQDTNIVVLDGNDKQVGSLGVSIGQCVYIEIGKRLWKLDPMQLFKMAHEAESEQYLK